MIERAVRTQLSRGSILVVVCVVLGSREVAAQEALSFRRAAPVPERAARPGETTVTVESATPHLDPIVLSPNIQYSNGNTTGGFVPVVQGQGEQRFVGRGLSGVSAQLRMLLKPSPPAAAPEDVAQQVKINAGLFSGGLGVKAGWFPPSLNPSGRGSLGIEGRVAMQAAFQRTQVATGTTGQVLTSNFGILNPEVVVGLWLIHAYLGYGYSHYWTFGDKDLPQDLKTLVNARNMHRILLSIPLEIKNADSDSKRLFYIEPSYAADGAAFDSGTVVVNVGVAFSPL